MWEIVSSAIFLRQNCELGDDVSVGPRIMSVVAGLSNSCASALRLNR